MITLRPSSRSGRDGPRPGRDRGTSAVEYSLLVAAITAVVAAIVFSVGMKVKTAFDDTCRSIDAAQSTGTPPSGLKRVVVDYCS